MDRQCLRRILVSLDKLSDTDDLETATNVLKHITQMLKDYDTRSSLDDEHWQTFSKLARKGFAILNLKKNEIVEMRFVAELFRCLRNSCAGSGKNQQFVLNTPKVYDFTYKALSIFLLRKEQINDDEIIALRCCLQLFGNLVCQGNTLTKTAVCNTYLKENTFVSLLQNKDLKVQEYTMMILYNCLSEDITSFIINSRSGHEILTQLTKSLSQKIFDWGILILETVIKNSNFMDNCYSILPLQNRLLILDIIAEKLDTAEKDTSNHVPIPAILYISKLFIEISMDIVQVCNSDADDLKVIEVIKLLSLLCTASLLEQYCNGLKSDKDLMEILIDSLKSVHLLGKTSCNAFSCISSLSETANISKEDIESNPSYGYKKNLICLIGNLCYNCKENQDLVRWLDGIPLLLDCCNLDARNPFIMQWCILAIRNILENNMENQDVLAGISVTGDMMNSSLLQELGFEVENRDGQFVLKSKESPS